MEKQLEIIQQILPLMETLDEAIRHMPQQLEELRHEEFFTMLKDFISGVESIEHALIPMEEYVPGIKKATIKRAKTMLNKSMVDILDSYEQENFYEVKQKTEKLNKKYASWRKQIEKELRDKAFS